MTNKITLRTLFLLSLFICIQVNARSNAFDKKSDSLSLPPEKYQPKKGYNLAPFPEFSIDPFNGLYIGINTSLFDYGNGSKYPDYERMFNLNAAWGTKGKTNLSIRYKQYGKNILSVKISHTKTNLFPFYGTNGYQTYYNKDYHTIGSDNYITTAFYNYKQTKSQFDFFFQNHFLESAFDWQVGISINYFDVNRVDFNTLNEKLEVGNINHDSPTLYDKYIGWNLIDNEEKNGGWANSARIAFIYDTRDRLTNPLNGTWAQITLRYTPEFFGNPKNSIQLGITQQQYFTLIDERVSFAYRLRYDATFGELAFYTRQVLADGTEGYGGASGAVGEGFGTIWGIHQNRIVAKQMALANFEFRAKIAYFRMFNQNWHLSAVPLFHTGTIIEPYKLDLSEVSKEDTKKFFRSSYKGWYSSFGLGGKVVMNENIVIGLDWAHSINKEAGGDAIYIGFGYSF